MDWRVGMLRAGSENVAWCADGTEPSWPEARAAAVTSLRDLVGREGHQEFRVQIGDVDGIVTPGVDGHGVVELDGIGESLPLAGR